jgi:hypothetical protein
LTEEEDEEIGHKAKACGFDLSEFFRRLAFGKKIDVQYEEKIIKLLF